MAGTGNSFRRSVNWAGLVLSLVSTLYFLNLVIYHFWAAYVPRYQTDLHQRWGIEASIILGASVVLFIWFGVRLWRGRAKA